MRTEPAASRPWSSLSSGCQARRVGQFRSFCTNRRLQFHLERLVSDRAGCRGRVWPPRMVFGLLETDTLRGLRPKFGVGGLGKWLQRCDISEFRGTLLWTSHGGGAGKDVGGHGSGHGGPHAVPGEGGGIAEQGSEAVDGKPSRVRLHARFGAEPLGRRGGGQRASLSVPRGGQPPRDGHGEFGYTEALDRTEATRVPVRRIRPPRRARTRRAAGLRGSRQSAPAPNPLPHRGRVAGAPDAVSRSTRRLPQTGSTRGAGPWVACSAPPIPRPTVSRVR